MEGSSCTKCLRKRHVPPRGLQQGFHITEGGEEYFYVDARTPASTSRWPRSEHSVAEAAGALANMAPLYAMNKSGLNLAYATYNDQPPTGTDGATVDSHGHTKGVILFDEQQGVWLVHSVPDFPGSLTADTTSSPTPAASTDKWRYVYETAVGITLGKDVLVSTWRNGRGGKLPPACNGVAGPRVLDVLQMRFDQASSNASLAFDNTEDHSKWAVSLPGKTWTHDKAEESGGNSDVGYVHRHAHRMQSQLRRGGETLCFRNAMLHGLLLNSVVSHDTCPRNTAAA
ncbi:hypothetical protein HPB52_011513 [Rhipicephalus sanguineus]|uniref:Uncharacterized protein n=1 Tax=Rhipicephalus sanguineus TaxID=34632 RepID=A0A9D4QCU3_RHISA|nr:hypothetical protein HPB52_011513 [Rhipicephalus sanguineus]